MSTVRALLIGFPVFSQAINRLAMPLQVCKKKKGIVSCMLCFMGCLQVRLLESNLLPNSDDARGSLVLVRVLGWLLVAGLVLERLLLFGTQRRLLRFRCFHNSRF